MMMMMKNMNRVLKSSRSIIRALNSSCNWCLNESSRSFSTTIDAASYHVNGGSSYMRGAVFWEPNKPLTFEDFHMPRPKANELLIKTKGTLIHSLLKKKNLIVFSFN